MVSLNSRFARGTQGYTRPHNSNPWGDPLDVIAYLDAGSGSMILQMLIGGVAAVGVTARLYWGRIKSFLRIGGKEADQLES